MKPNQKPDHGLICIALLITLATFMVTGCMESATEQHVQPAATDGKQIENTGAKAVTVPKTITAQPSPATDPSAPFITIDPVGDKNIGDLLIISGTTNLPEKTPVFLSKTYGSSGDEMIMATRLVLAGTNGTNRWRFGFDSSVLKPGSYKMTVATERKDAAATTQFSLAGTFLGTDNPIHYSGASRPGSAGTPSITVQPPGDRQQGDVFLISGTTSLEQGTVLFCLVQPAYYEDKTKKPVSSSGGSLMSGGNTLVIRGTGDTNRWSFAMDTDGYEKTEYLVNVSTVNEDYTRREIFRTALFTIR